MSDIFDDLKSLGLPVNNTPQLNTNSNNTINPNNNSSTQPSQGSLELFKSLGLDKVFNSTADAGNTNTGISNPSFDPDRTEFNKELPNSWFNNSWNSFRNAINDTNINTEIGKLNYNAGAFGQGVITGATLGAETIIDNYDTELKKLENNRTKGLIDDNTYTTQLNNLNDTYSKAQTDYQNSQNYIAEQTAAKNSRVISKSYQAQTQRVQQKGDDAGFIETLQYAAPQTFGSSASLMLPQMAASFTSGFVEGAATTVAGTLGIGSEIAPIIGTVAGIGSAIAELTWGRAQESYGEIGSTIQDSRDKMESEYMSKNHLQDKSQIPDEVLKNIRIQSRKGADIQFKENMALVAQDIPAALLMPMNTLSETFGIAKGLRNISGTASEILENAKGYNLLTKGLFTAAGLRAEMATEQFEEGYQYAAQKRAESAIYDLDGYKNKNFIGSVFDDAYNTVASLNYTLIPGVTPSLRGDGKYVLDKEFQNSDNSGAFLSMIMGGTSATLGTIREIQGYKKAQSDIIKQGLFDVDSKTERINADLLRSYFSKGQTERLVTAIRSVADKTDENGNVFYDANTGNQVISDIRDAYKTYQGITDHLDSMPKRGLLGLFNTKDQNSMRSMYESDALTTSLNLKRQIDTNNALESNKIDILNNEYLAGDNVQTNQYKDLLAKKEALEGLIQVHNNESELTKIAPKDIKSNLQKELDTVNSDIESELQLLKDSGIDTDTISNPSRNLVSINNSIYVNQQYNKDQINKYNELNKVKTEQDLIDYYNRNKDRTNLQDIVENIKGSTVDNVSNTRTPVEVVNDTTEGYDPDPANQVVESGISQDDINGLPTINENTEDTPVSTIPGPGSLGLDTQIDTSKMSTDQRNDLLKTGLETILSIPGVSNKDVEDTLKFGGLDIKSTPIDSIISKIKEVLTPEQIVDNLDTIKSIIASAKNVNTDSIQFEAGLSDPSQPLHLYNNESIDSDNEKLENNYKQSLEINPTQGYKIFNPLSIANRNVGFVGNEDSYDQSGKLIFNTINPNQHIVNTNVIQVGQQVTISIANPEILDTINLNDSSINSIGKNTDINSSDNPLDDVELLITTSVDNQIIPIGYMHKIGYITNQSFDNPTISIIEARQELRQQRLNLIKILKDDPSQTFTSTIIDKGFGHLSLNEKGTLNTVKNTINEDTRPYLTIANEVGLPVTRDNKSTYENINTLAPGASLLMIPNEIAGTTQYIPTYLTKQQLSNDSRAFTEVTKGINEFLQGADNVWGRGIDQWLYTSINNKSDARKLGTNGIGLSNEGNNGTKIITINNTKYTYNRNTQIYQIQGITGPFQTVSLEEFWNGTNRDGLTFAGLNSDLGNLYPSLNKSMLQDSKLSTNYQNKMMNSPLYRTRIAQNDVLANLNNSLVPQGQQYQYFAQHTVSIDSTIIPDNLSNNKIGQLNDPSLVSEYIPTDNKLSELQSQLEGLKKLSNLGINKTSEIAEVQSQIDQLSNDQSNPNQINTEEDLNNALGELGLELPDDIAFDIDINTNDTSNNKNLFIDKDNIPYSVQSDILNSVAYLLVNNDYNEDLSNSDKIKNLFQSKLDNYKTVLGKITQNKFPVQFSQISKLIKYYQSSLDNWDKVISMSNTSLEKVGFISDDRNGYYDNLEENLENIEETEGVQFDDDSDRTRNAQEFVPSDVKKLLYFIPATRKLDENNINDKKLIDSTGKEYGPINNSLGLPGFNNFNDTWVKLLNITTEREFPSDRATGWPKLLQALSDTSNPYVIRELAIKVQKLPSNIQNAFFNTVVLQRQNNITTKTTYSESGAKTSSIFAADRSTTINALTNVMKSSFLDSSIITISTDEVGRQIKVVDTNRGKELLSDSKDILDNDNSYEPGSKKNKFTKEARENLYKTISNAGIDISLSAFEDVLRNNKIEGVSKEVANYNSIFQTKILQTIAGNNSNDSETNIDKNNPFVNEYTQMRLLASYEAKYRTELQHGGVRQGDKTYFPFTKPSFISEKIGNIVEFVKNKLSKDGFINLTKIDKFASTSQILQNTINNTLSGFGINYELGSSLTGKNQDIKMLKEMTPREHQITKFINYQNAGNKLAYFFYDTLSDKSTMPLISLNRSDISYGKQGSIDTQTIQLSDDVLDNLYKYVDAEYNRILEVQEQNKNLPRIEQIKGYHGNGVGTKFLIYSIINKPMLDISNPDLSKQMYQQDGTLLPATSSIISGIKSELNKHFNDLFKRNKEDARELGIFSTSYDKNNNFIGDVTDLVDMNYLTKGNNNSIASRIGLTNNPNWSQFKSTGNANYLGDTDTNKLVDYVIADYVVNYSIKTNEMLQLTGDPAQMGKVDNSDVSDINSVRGAIKARYKNVPNGELLAAREMLQVNITNTLNNVSKRNAAFMGSGGKGLFKSSDYTVAIAKDIAINSKDSDIVEYYKSLFSNRDKDIIKAYEKGDIADAQEFTTVREKLTVMEAFAKIDRDQMLTGIYKYDKRDFDRIVNNPNHNDCIEYQEFAKTITPEKLANFGEIIMQPDKPVQRTGVLDSKLGITKQFYIKTSSFPLLPDLVKGGPLQQLLEDMQDNDVDRISFASGVKLGVSLDGPGLFNSDGEYNTNFFNGNKTVLNRDGFRIQLEVPYDPGKKAIREGTQQAKMIFVDVDDNMKFNGRTGRELKDNYRQLHQDIFDIKKQQFLDEVGAINDNGTYRFTNLNKLSQVLQREAIDRGYSLNSILGLELNSQGNFKIPLTFNPTIGKIEPVITAIITNRITKSKLPGHSYVQGSEFILNTGKKGKVLSGDNLDKVLHTNDKRSILWTKPEYANTNKLGYLRMSGNKVQPAQLLMSPHISIGSQKINVNDYTIEIDGKQYLDTNRIDPTLLETNGFRIPFQGHNSGMWFEIIGFLPESVGDLIIVPGEIAAQMGSDYDVDKLYTYQFNYYTDNGDIKKITSSTTLDNLNKDVKYKNKLVKAELSKLVKSELSVNQLLNNFITDDNLKLDENERLLVDSLMKQALDNLGIDSSELKFLTEEDLEIKKKQNDIIDIHKDIYTGNEELFTSILNPLSFDLINQAIDETAQFSPVEESIPQFIHDPLYQRDLYFSNSYGKIGCLGYGTKVVMFNGTLKEVQDVVVGDQLMGPDSTPRNVLDLCRNREQMYWVRQNKGLDYRVNESHILSLSLRNPWYKTNKIVNIKLSDYLNESQQFKKLSYGYKCEGINFEEKEVPLCPYYLGLWIGDGSKKSYGAISNIDPEIRDYLQNTYGIKRVEGLNDLTMFITNKELCEGFKKAFSRTVAALTPKESKYIPDLYLYNSKEVRLQFLAGLIDSDGTYISASKQYSITTNDINLREQICFITRSLGFYTSWTKTNGNTKSYPNGKTYTCKPWYTIRFTPLCEIPVKLSRKKQLPRLINKNSLITGFKIEKDIVDNYYGFELDGDHLFLLEDFTVTHNTAISALANTAHAQSQETNLFITGDGILIQDSEGKLLVDNANTNRTNEYSKNLYQYNSGDSIVDQANTNSIWRLDKVNTFPDSKGRTYKISDLISQVLGVSVDNAKEQVLGRFGLNQINFNTGLTLIRLGLDLATTKKIITQPILIELNKRLAGLNDMYNIDYTADKKNSTIRNLINEIVDQFKLSSNYNETNLLARESVRPINISELENSLIDGNITESNAIQQLEVLKSWLGLTKISDSLQSIQSAYNIDSAGLPKNISDTLTKRNRIIEIQDNKLIGNINRYAQYSLSGVYKEAPTLAVNLYLNETNPLLNYNTETYTNIFNSILSSTGRDQFFTNQKDIVNNNIKQYVYSNFLNRTSSLDNIKQDLFINNPISNKYDELIKKYPRDKFLTSINKVSTAFANDPITLEIAISSEDNYVQEVSEAWLYAYTQSEDTQLSQFAKDMFNYTLAVSPQEYGSSSIVRYIPFQIMEQEGLLDYLNEVNQDLNTYGGLDNLTQQFLQHNIDFALSVKQSMLVKNSEVKFNPSDKTWGIQSFKLPNPNSDNNKAQGLRRQNPDTLEYYYPNYVSFFANEQTGKRLYRLTNDESGSTYEIISSLGSTNISEYDDTKVNQTSMFIENRVQANQRIDSGALLEQFGISSIDNSNKSDFSNITIPQLVSESRIPNDILSGLNGIMSKYEYNSNEDNKKLATYYNLLIDKLQSQNYEGVNIEFTNQGNSSTSTTGNNIVINKKRALSNVNKANLNSDLNTTRVILHELLHSAIFRSNRNTQEYKQIENVYNEYRNTIFNSRETIRGVNEETLTAEIFTQLVNNLKLQSQELDINSIQDSSNLTDEAIRSLLQQVSKNMIQLANQGKIEPNRALYDFSNSAREQYFITHVKDIFTKDNLSELINRYYSYSDINEFITEVSTNPETQEIFKKLPSIWQQFKNSISNLLAKIFGIESNDRTLFNDAIDSVFNFISKEELDNNNISLYEQPNTTIEEQDNNIDQSPFDVDINESDIEDLPCA